MSVTTRFLIATYVLPPATFGICTLVLNCSREGLLLFFGSIGYFYYIKFSTKCPSCQNRVWAGVPVFKPPDYWKWGIPLKCEHCGFSFRNGKL
jgi:hypothetical protein